MKIFFRNIHLYLSLVSGLIIAVVCLTGGVLVFEKELEQAWHPERYFVAPATTPALPLNQLTAAVKAYKADAKITGVKVYTDPHTHRGVQPGRRPGRRAERRCPRRR